MTNYYEIDFLSVGENDSGDAICLRYGDSNAGTETVHVVDGGYTNDGSKVLSHIGEHYTKQFIEHVVLTHPDEDHALGLKTVLTQGSIGNLWMNRPWLCVDELLPLFEYEYTRDGLIQRLKKNFPHTAALENIAIENGIKIHEAFQGAHIGEFVVLSPSRHRYIDLVVNSEKTPETKREATYLGQIYKKARELITYIRSAWGEENLKGGVGMSSRENEMSIVQYSELADHKVLLTGDSGVEGLEEAYNYAVGVLSISLPGLNRFQVPHHGARRNINSEILDKWLGERLPNKPELHQLTFSTAISANMNDPEHPKKAVKRAMWHRGGSVSTTENCGGFLCWFNGIEPRTNCSPAEIHSYPDDTEE